MAQTRRTFLATIGAAAVAAACGHSGSGAIAAAPAGRRKLKAVGIQLYTLRRPAAADLAGTLSQLAKIGYKEIEFAGFYNHPAAEVRDILKANGLTAPSTHIGLNVIQGARISGALKIIAIDLSDSRLEMATGFGATDTLRASREDAGLRDAAAQVRSLTDGRGAD